MQDPLRVAPRSAPRKSPAQRPAPRISQPSLDANLIRTRAYHLWEQEGRPQGRELDHWREAERQLGVEFQFSFEDDTPSAGEQASP